jgi:hypothetical protein
MNKPSAVALAVVALALTFAVIVVFIVLMPSHKVNILTNRYDTNRTGANIRETVLNTANVNPTQFGKVFTRAVVGDIYAQPLYVMGLDIPGNGKHNVIFVATMHNEVYAFDADDPAQSAPLWEVNLGPACPTDDRGDVWNGEVGILSTPVIDLATETMYLVSMHQTDNVTSHMIHALDITTGQEKLGGPTTIQASIAGTGQGSVDGRIMFDSSHQWQRPGLVLANGRVYAAFGGIANTPPYHGWLIGYRADDLTAPPVVWNVTPDGERGGIWQGGTAPVVDSAGDIYLASGNGTFNDHTDYGDSFIRLRTANDQLTPVDYFTPFNQQALFESDYDLGSGGLVMIPGTNLVVGGGKDGKLYLVDGNAMGRWNSVDNSQIKQSFDAYKGILTNSPVIWSGPTTTHVYVWGQQDHLKEYRFANGQMGESPSSTSLFRATGSPGGAVSVSSDGNKPGTGILWALQVSSGKLAVLHAVDAIDLSHELWNSDMNGERDRVGNVAKFNAPLVANGKVFVSTFSDQLVVYGLLPTPSTPIPSAALAPTGTGNGLQAQYFGDEALGSLIMTRIDGNIDFNWEQGSPDPAVPVDGFSVRWSGKVQPLSTGYYTFYVTADDGARLWVDGIPLFDHWLFEADSESSGTIFLEAGQKYDLKLEYFEDSAGARVSLKWSGPDVPKAVIPQSQLFPK